MYDGRDEEEYTTNAWIAHGFLGLIILYVLYSLLVMSGCSYAREPAGGLSVECWAVECPPMEELTLALEIFADTYPAFDPTEPLLVEWHAAFEILQQPATVGLTHSGEHIEVTGWGTLFHELVHVSHWRTGRAPDYDHALGEGAWTTLDDCLIEGMKHHHHAVVFGLPGPNPSALERCTLN